MGILPGTALAADYNFAAWQNIKACAPGSNSGTVVINQLLHNTGVFHIFGMSSTAINRCISNFQNIFNSLTLQMQCNVFHAEVMPPQKTVNM